MAPELSELSRFLGIKSLNSLAPSLLFSSYLAFPITPVLLLLIQEYLEFMDQTGISVTPMIKILPVNFQVHYFGKDDLNFHWILQDPRHMLGFQ